MPTESLSHIAACTLVYLLFKHPFYLHPSTTHICSTLEILSFTLNLNLTRYFYLSRSIFTLDRCVSNCCCTYLFVWVSECMLCRMCVLLFLFEFRLKMIAMTWTFDTFPQTWFHFSSRCSFLCRCQVNVFAICFFMLLFYFDITLYLCEESTMPKIFWSVFHSFCEEICTFLTKFTML